MPLDRLPLSLQQHLLLEWISPSAVYAVARSGSTSLRTAVLFPPCGGVFRAAPSEVLDDSCVRWFSEWGLTLVLWSSTIVSRDGIRRERNGKLHSGNNDLPAFVSPREGSEEWWYRDGKLHRDGDLPAFRFRGYPRRTEWWKYGMKHRDGDQPAVIVETWRLEWWQNDLRHRENVQPAIVLADGTREWWLLGKKYMVAWPWGKRSWYRDGKLHRDDDLPAVIEADGSQMWYQHGKLHRRGDRPAVVWANGSQHWWKRGMLHREDGQPAIVEVDGRRAWYRYGAPYRPPPMLLLLDGEA